MPARTCRTAIRNQRLAVADEALNVVRLTGDACVSAFFAGSKKKQREERCEELFASVSDWYASGHDPAKRAPVAAAVASLRNGRHQVPPFHWEIEFPEVFSRANGGFEAFVGNPPFLGGRNMTSFYGSTYPDALRALQADISGSADLVAHFFRRAFALLRSNGCFGLIATNSIAQGDTRGSGLRWIRKHGGHIFAARRRVVWPGEVAVVVSVVHICNGTPAVEPRLDGNTVGKITAYLFHQGGDDDPYTLNENDKKSFQGSIILGMGFTFDDTDSSGTATSISTMHELIERDSRNSDRIFPYLGGSEGKRQSNPLAPPVRDQLW